MSARESKSDDRTDLSAGTPPLEARKAMISIAANHKQHFQSCTSTCHVRAFHAKALGSDAGKIGLMKKSMYGTTDAASNWER